MGAAGQTTVDFGTFPGASQAVTTVTGQSGISSGSQLEAWIQPADTADHLHDEHIVENLRVRATNIVPGVGFDIVAEYLGNFDSIGANDEPGYNWYSQTSLATAGASVSPSSSSAQYAVLASNVGSTVPWSTPSNAQGAPDGLGTSATIASGATTDLLQTSNYSFGLPVGATIVGIEVTITANAGTNPAQIAQVYLLGGNGENTSGLPRGGTTIPVGGFVNYTIGGPSDLWGTTWLVSSFASGNFFVETSFTNVSGGSSTGRIDAVRVTVYYTTSSGSSWSSPSNITADDGSASTVTLASGSSNTDYLIATFGGFTIPSNATIQNMVIGMERQASAASVIADVHAFVRKNGTNGSTDLSRGAVWPTSYALYSFNPDTGGFSWSSADINAGYLQFAWAASIDATGGSRTASVDYATATVNYTLPLQPYDPAAYGLFNVAWVWN